MFFWNVGAVQNSIAMFHRNLGLPSFVTDVKNLVPKYILYMGCVERPFHSRISLGACDCSYFHLCLKGSRQDSTDYSQDAICAINLCTHCTGKHNSELASLKSNFAARD